MSFDTLAPFYRSLEFVTAGGILQRCRTAFLAEAADCRRALVLGEGPGRFLVELLRTNPRVEVTSVERSSRMIEESRRNLQRHGLELSRVQFEQCDILDWAPSFGAFDLLISHFFLDCFRPDEVESIVAKLDRSAMESARWLLADFCVPTGGWRKWRASVVLSLMYGFFRLTAGLTASRLTPPDAFLAAAGFRLTQRRLGNFGLVHSDLWSRTRS